MKTFFCFYCLVVAIPSFCQNAAPGKNFPAPVGGASFVYHPQSDALLLIGGSAAIPDSAKSNVWSWNGKYWTHIEATGPGSRHFFPSVLQTRSGIIYSFGGINAVTNTSMKDLWSFNGRNWSRVRSDDIGTHDHHNMVYIDHLDAFLVYGGNINGYPNFDTATWLLKDGKFSRLNIPGPGYRWHYGLVYDKERKKAILYGGGEKPGEQWEFDGERWSKIIRDVNPGKRLYHHMVYNEDTKSVILHGGMVNQDPRDPVNDSTPTTWAWDGNKWKKIAEDKVFAMAMGYDPKRKKVVIYGKTSRTDESSIGLWELNGDRWVRIADYGKWDLVDYVKKWTQQHPDDLQALIKYADILEWRTKQFDLAEVAYKKLLGHSPQDPRMLTALAYVLSAQGKTEEAKVQLETLKSIGALNKGVYARLAGRLYQEKKFRESIVFYNKSLETDPKGNEYYKLACAYAKIDEKEKAFENLNKAIENGYHSKKQFEDDAELASLRTDRRFGELVLKLK